MIGLEAFRKLSEESEESISGLPLLTLDEFFDGNTGEDTIAPNQCDFGRPSLAEIWKKFRETEARPDVAWVRVALHDDTQITEYNGKEVLELWGESIVLCTTVSADKMEKLVNCRWLCSDGVIETDVSELYARIPAIPKGFHCLEVVWD